jgi:hypothetical protein
MPYTTLDNHQDGNKILVLKKQNPYSKKISSKN